jgi:PAS domain S-box-containing protein
VREGDRDFGDDDTSETVADTAESLLAFENAALPLCVVHPNGQVVMANRALRALLGYEFDELTGKSVHEVVLGDPRTVLESWRERLESGARVTPERRLQLRHKDGSPIAVRASSVSVRDSHGAIRYLVARAVPEGS